MDEHAQLEVVYEGHGETWQRNSQNEIKLIISNFPCLYSLIVSVDFSLFNIFRFSSISTKVEFAFAAVSDFNSHD